MNQQDLSGLSLNVEKFIGTTCWTNITQEKPPFIGWWKTRRDDMPGETPRRWWCGVAWSFPVALGDSDEDTEAAKQHRAHEDLQNEIEWCGLTTEVPCPYPLVASARLWRFRKGLEK